MQEDMSKRMERLEGMAHKLKNMAKDNASLEAMEHQLTIMDGIVRKAKVALLRAELEAAKAKDVDGIMKRIEPLLR